MRITGGTFRSRALRAPHGQATRPTSDRVREALFGILASNGAVEGARVLDLYAGTGALGLEALSRGAARCVFVDSSREACRTIAANLELLGLTATVLRQDAERALAADPGPYQLVLADPPYAFGAYERLAAPLVRLLDRDGLAVLQTPARREPALPGLRVRTSRRYGSARLTLFEP